MKILKALAILTAFSNVAARHQRNSAGVSDPDCENFVEFADRVEKPNPPVPGGQLKPKRPARVSQRKPNRPRGGQRQNAAVRGTVRVGMPNYSVVLAKWRNYCAVRGKVRCSGNRAKRPSKTNVQGGDSADKGERGQKAAAVCLEKLVKQGVLKKDKGKVLLKLMKKRRDLVEEWYLKVQKEKAVHSCLKKRGSSGKHIEKVRAGCLKYVEVTQYLEEMEVRGVLTKGAMADFLKEMEKDKGLEGQMYLMAQQAEEEEALEEGN